MIFLTAAHPHPSRRSPTGRGHGLISEVTYNKIMAVCTWSNENQACQDALNDAANEVGNIDVYYL